MSFVAIDVETANHRKGAICSIGLARFEGKEVVSEHYSLIRPPEAFGDFNYYCTDVHGLRAADVATAPSFGEAFPDIAAFIGDDLLVAHNAPFDSGHIHGAMSFFGITQTYDFACTLSLSRRMLRLPNYKLNTVCKHLNITLDNYHNALADAIACGKVYAMLTTETDHT